MHQSVEGEENVVRFSPKTHESDGLGTDSRGMKGGLTGLGPQQRNLHVLLLKIIGVLRKASRIVALLQ
jgi:hypothetical protein